MIDEGKGSVERLLCRSACLKDSRFEMEMRWCTSQEAPEPSTFWIWECPGDATIILWRRLRGSIEMKGEWIIQFSVPVQIPYPERERVCFETDERSWWDVCVASVFLSNQKLQATLLSSRRENWLLNSERSKQIEGDGSVDESRVVELELMSLSWDSSHSEPSKAFFSSFSSGWVFIIIDKLLFSIDQHNWSLQTAHSTVYPRGSNPGLQRRSSGCSTTTPTNLARILLDPFLS